MAIGCGPKTAKIIFTVFNALFWVGGLIMIIISAVCLSTDGLPYFDDITDSLMYEPLLIGFLVIGIVIFVIGISGYYGAYKEIRGLLGIYIVLLLCIIVAEIGIGLSAVIVRYQWETFFKYELERDVKKDYGSDPTVTAVIDQVQQIYKCCGVDEHEDWSRSNWANYYRKDSNQLVPQSCCSEEEVPCWSANSDNDYSTVFQEGCYFKFVNFKSHSLSTLIAVVFGTALFEIVVVLCAFGLWRNTKVQIEVV